MSEATPATAERDQRLSRQLRRHRLAYLGALILAIGLMVVQGTAVPWLFWTMAGWTIAFMVHFFVVRSITVDESWVDGRAAELRYKSYDLGHIHDIEGRLGNESGAQPPVRLAQKLSQADSHEGERNLSPASDTEKS